MAIDFKIICMVRLASLSALHCYHREDGLRVSSETVSYQVKQNICQNVSQISSCQ